MGLEIRRGVLVSLLVVGMGMLTAHARPFSQDTQELRGAGGGAPSLQTHDSGPPEIRGPAPDAPGRSGPAGSGPDVEPAGCTRSGQANTIDEAFDVALERWLRAAKGIYGRQYSMVDYDYDLSYVVNGTRAEGGVSWTATVFDHAIDAEVNATGSLVDVRFAKMGCNWQLVSFDY